MTHSRALQRTIHVACRELGLDREARHALQLAVTGKESLSEMTDAEMRAVLDKLKRDGFRLQARARPAAPRADLRLIHVLWRKLASAGVLDRPDRAGLNAFVRSRFEAAWGSVPADVDMLRDHEKIEAVIRALKDWGRRAGIDFDWGRR